jgi:threonine/homoserine/homoserine lactone efflux protein
MAPYFLLGSTLGFAAAAQPGPMQAYLISQAVNHGWRRVLPIAFAPLLSDLPIASLSIFVLSRVPAWFTLWLRFAGGALLLYLAWGTYRVWRFPSSAPPEPLSARKGAWQGALVNLLNPNPWIAWTLVIGPLVVKAWRETPAGGIAFLAGFYGVLLSGMVATALLFGMARRLGPGVGHALTGLSAAVLAAFGCYLAASGISGLRWTR